MWAEIAICRCISRTLSAQAQAWLDGLHDSELGEVYHGPDVLTGASQYIQQFQQIPAYANISGRIEAESRLNELRGRMREIVRADFQKPGQLTWDHMQRALRQIDSSAACRGIPYAALLSESHPNACFVFQMQGLAYKLGMTAKSWTMQDLYHAVANLVATLSTLDPIVCYVSTHARVAFRRSCGVS